MSNQRLNVMIDSYSLKTVAATLLFLADQAELNIIVSGTPEECMSRKTEIEKLLANSRYHQPTFGFAVSIDFSAMRTAHLWDIASGTEPNTAFKLRGIEKRSLTEAEAQAIRDDKRFVKVFENGQITPEGEAMYKLHDFGYRGTK